MLWDLFLCRSWEEGWDWICFGERHYALGIQVVLAAPGECPGIAIVRMMDLNSFIKLQCSCALMKRKFRAETSKVGDRERDVEAS